MMRRLMLIVALNALLQPVSVLAQCEEEDWHATTSTISPTVPSIASTSPLIVLSEYDESIYTIYVLQSNATSDVEFQIEGLQYQISSCWPGKVFLVQKRSHDGQLLWYRTGCFSNDGLVNGMAVDSLGNLYFGGYFTGNLNYDGNTLDQSPLNIWSHYTLKIDPMGTVDWLQSGLRSSSTGHTWSEQGLLIFLAVTDSTTYNGQAFYNQGSTSTTEYVLLMVDAQGEVVWNRHLGGNGNKFVREVSCEKGICIVQGFYMDSVAYGSLQLNQGEGRMFQLAIASNDGNGLWMKDQDNAGTSVYTYCSEILDDGSFITGGAYVGGAYEFVFQGQSISSSNGLTDGFLMRQDLSSGNLIWLKTLGAPGYSTIFGMDKTQSGVIVTGEFDSPSLSYEGIQITNHSELHDPFIIVIDTLGKPTCYFEGLGSQTPESGNNILTWGDEVFWLLGFNDSTSFDGNDVASSGNADRLVWKTCLPCDRISSVREEQVDQTFIRLESDPNPFSDYTDIQYEHDGCTDCQIIITDMSGRIIKRIRTEGTKGTVRVYSSEIGTGVFNYSIIENNQVIKSAKMVSSK